VARWTKLKLLQDWQGMKTKKPINTRVAKLKLL
jgi:hypothetical protein